ncbi:hypothetical protein MTP99_002598 [Tenebrio molitor]|jgi:hypothetical protein|nr:hypothetical protein MTP99_002598 [Tenebrio molitor]
MDPEDFENVTLNDTEFGQEIHYQRPSDLVLIPTAIVTLLSIVADVLTIYLIAKFKNLRTTVNLYILNWRICNVLFLTLSPINFIVLAFVEYVYKDIICVWFGEILVTLTGNFMFAIALTLDWCILNYASQSFALKVRSHYKVNLALLWLLMALLSVVICFHCVYISLIEWTFVVVTTFFIFILIVHIFRLFKLRTSSSNDEKSNLVLILVSLYFLVWVPNYVVHSIKTFDSERFIYSEFFIFSSLIGYSYSLILILFLYLYDRNFQSSFKTLCNYASQTSDTGSSYESIDIKSNQATSLI